MGQDETPLELAQRHVAAGRARVVRQTALVAALARRGHDTETARALLDSMQDSLRLMYEHLAQEQMEAADIAQPGQPWRVSRQ